MSTTTLAEASRTMLRLYKDELSQKGITAPTPAVKALEAALAADPTTIIRELLGAVHAAKLDREGWVACKRAEAWLAENWA